MPDRRAFSVPFGSALAFRVAYMVVIVLATIAEPGGATDSALAHRLGRALDAEVSGRDVVDGVRNVLLFAGWGAVWVVTSLPGPAKPMLVRATLTGALLSGAVEAGQLLSATRVASVLDLVTNTVGSLAGAFAVALLIVGTRAALGRRSYLGIPAVLFALGYGIATFLEAFSPFFRQERLPGVWGSPGERLHAAIARFDWSSISSIPWLDLVLFAPAGMLGVAALVETGVPHRRAAIRVVAGAALLYVFAELARGVAGYPIVLGALLAHVAGVAAGGWLAARRLASFSRELRGRARPAAVFISYCVILALWILRPFLPEVDLTTIADKLTLARFIPLMAYRERMDVFTAADVAIPAFLLMPAGALLAVWPLRAKGWLAGVLPAVYAAILLETGQIFVIGRLFDITDILVASAAAVLGWSVIRRAGYRPYGAMLRPAPPAAVKQTTDFTQPGKRRTS
ncbi:MAG: VanZ family protein [Longimicrobiales bacterium]